MGILYLLIVVHPAPLSFEKTQLAQLTEPTSSADEHSIVQTILGMREGSEKYLSERLS